MKIIYYFSVFILLSLLPIHSFCALEILGSTVHKQTGLPGDIHTGTIKIYNAGDFNQEVKVYPTDYLFNYKGQSFYNKPVSHKRSNANWIEFSPKFIILKAKETQYIQYEVKIPQDDSLSGTYWSILMVEGVNPINTNSSEQLNIKTSTRFANQIITNLTNKGIGELRFMQPTLLSEGDIFFFDVVMENTGTRLISPKVTAEFFDETGNSVKIFETAKNGMYPSTSALFRFRIEGIKSKKTYQVLIIADGGNDDVFGLESTLSL